VENGFHVRASIADKYLIADKMRAAGEHFKDVGDNIGSYKVGIVCKKTPPVSLIQQDIADFFAFDQLQVVILCKK
jgi:hypothetical protein